jgi:hypothetical protein
MVLFGSLLDQFVGSFARAYALSIFELDSDWFIDFSPRILINRFHGLILLLLIRIKDQDLCCSWWWYLCQFKLWNLLIELGCFAGSMVGPTILLFFRCFFWRSGLLEWWIRSYILGHWFGCSLRPGTQFNSHWTLDSSAVSWSLTLLIKEQQRQLLQDEWLTTLYYPRLSLTQNPCLYTAWY